MVPPLLLVTILLGLATTTAMTIACWRSVPLRVAWLVLVGVHVALLGVLCCAPPRVLPTPFPSILAV
jgi:hypothetical protein